MTDEATKARDEQLMAAFAVILTHPAGFGIQIEGDLWIERIEGDRFGVVHLKVDEKTLSAPEETFDDVRSAIAYYLDKREELKLGLDIEKAN